MAVCIQIKLLVFTMARWEKREEGKGRARTGRWRGGGEVAGGKEEGKKRGRTGGPGRGREREGGKKGWGVRTVTKDQPFPCVYLDKMPIFFLFAKPLLRINSNDQY